MWSSTASSSSTITIDKKYDAPKADDIINDCCKERKFYKPDEQYDHNELGYNIFDNSLNKPKLIEPSTIDQVKVNSKQNFKDDLIQIWANQTLFDNNQTLGDTIINEENENEFLKKNLPGRAPDATRYAKLPYILRSQCYPKLVCHLGGHSSFNIFNTNIVQFINYGIQLFLIDLRYVSPRIWHKLHNHFEKIRKKLENIAPSSNIFGLAFMINGRTFQVGLMYKNQPVYLDHGSTIILTADRHFCHRGTNKVIYVNFSNYVNNFEQGDEIKIGIDDEIIVVVNGKAMNSIVCTVKKGGLIIKQMPVKIPLNRFVYPPPLISIEEHEDIKFAITVGCDYIISPCITDRLRQHIDWGLAVNNRLVLLLQKISFSKQSVPENFDDIGSIFNVCDGIYVGGDCAPENYKLQSDVLKTAIKRRKVIFHASFMMRKKDVILDNEALKCLLLYPHCIVFSPQKCDFTTIINAIRAIYPEMNSDNFALSLSPICQQEREVESVLCRQIILLAACEKASCIIVVNNSGHFVRLLGVNRPMIPVIASFLETPYARNCLHCRNVYVNIFQSAKPACWTDEVGMRLKSCIEFGKKINCIKDDIPFIFCYNSKVALKQCNTVRLLCNSENNVRLRNYTQL